MKKYLLLGSLLLVTMLALGVAGFAYAQSQNPPTPQPPAENQFYRNFPGTGLLGNLRGLLQGRWQNMPHDMPGGLRGMMQGWRQGFRQGMMGGMMGGFAQGAYGPMHTDMLQALADQLGISLEDLQTKLNAGQSPFDIAKAQGMTDEQVQDLMEKAHDAALEAMVAAGVLTQAQADAMDKNMEQMWQNGEMSWMMGGFRGQRMGLGTVEGPLHDYKVQAFAAAVGLTVEQVETRLAAGETMWQIAQAQGLTAEQFQAKMTEATTAAINQAVADGKLTQAQADQMLSRAGQMGAFGFGRGMFGRGGCPMGGTPAQP